MLFAVTQIEFREADESHIALGDLTVTIRTSNMQRKKLRCLKCGESFWTDRCHRVCRKCNANSSDIFVKPMLSAEGITVLSDFPLVEELAIVDDGDSSDTVTLANDPVTKEGDA